MVFDRIAAVWYRIGLNFWRSMIMGARLTRDVQTQQANITPISAESMYPIKETDEMGEIADNHVIHVNLSNTTPQETEESALEFYEMLANRDQR